MRGALVGSPDLARRWAALLLEGGAIDDVRAAKELRVERGELEAAAEGLDRALAALTG